VPWARLSWSSRQFLSACKYTILCHIVNTGGSLLMNDEGRSDKMESIGEKDNMA